MGPCFWNLHYLEKNSIVSFWILAKMNLRRIIWFLSGPLHVWWIGTKNEFLSHFIDRNYKWLLRIDFFFKVSFKVWSFFFQCTLHFASTVQVVWLYVLGKIVPFGPERQRTSLKSGFLKWTKATEAIFEGSLFILEPRFHCGSEQHLIVHFPMSLWVNEWASKRLKELANEWAGQVNGQVSGPELTSQFSVVLDHGGFQARVEAIPKLKSEVSLNFAKYAFIFSAPSSLHRQTHYGTKPVILRHQKFTFPQARESAKWESEQTSECCEQTSKRMSEWPSTYVSILVCSRPQWPHSRPFPFFLF